MGQAREHGGSVGHDHQCLGVDSVPESIGDRGAVGPTGCGATQLLVRHELLQRPVRAPEAHEEVGELRRRGRATTVAASVATSRRPPSVAASDAPCHAGHPRSTRRSVAAAAAWASTPRAGATASASTRPRRTTSRTTSTCGHLDRPASGGDVGSGLQRPRPAAQRRPPRAARPTTQGGRRSSSAPPVPSRVTSAPASTRVPADGHPAVVDRQPGGADDRWEVPRPGQIAAWLTSPPDAVRMPRATAIAATSAGEVSGRTSTTSSPASCRRSASATVVTRTPTPRPGLAARPLTSTSIAACAVEPTATGREQLPENERPPRPDRAGTRDPPPCPRRSSPRRPMTGDPAGTAAGTAGRARR